MSTNIKRPDARFPGASTCTSILLRVILAGEAGRIAQPPTYPERMVAEAGHGSAATAPTRAQRP